MAAHNFTDMKAEMVKAFPTLSNNEAVWPLFLEYCLGGDTPEALEKKYGVAAGTLDDALEAARLENATLVEHILKFRK